jgi:hypothetical protein
MATKYTLHYIGNVPRLRLEDCWCVWVEAHQPRIAFYQFATLEDAVATYPQVRDQAIAFHLEHAQRELNDYAAPGCDDPYTIRLLNARLTACRRLVGSA